jgi:two-component system NarL family sensor kinase
MNYSYLLPLLIGGSTLFTLLLFFITLFVLVNKTKQRRSYMEKKELEYKFEKELLITRIEVQEQALNLVSQEIHDGICQVLGRVKSNLYAMAYNINIDDSVDLVQESTTLVGNSIEDLRNISHVINPEYIRKIGLEEAIQKELQYLKSFYKIEIKLDLVGEPLPILKEKELITFRIVQQALANIVKHSKATEVTVRIEYSESCFLMTITDNGTGFDTETDGSKGIGLINMKQRAQLINGIFDVESSPNKGTKISLRVNATV